MGGAEGFVLCALGSRRGEGRGEFLFCRVYALPNRGSGLVLWRPGASAVRSSVLLLLVRYFVL